MDLFLPLKKPSPRGSLKFTKITQLRRDYYNRIAEFPRESAFCGRGVKVPLNRDDIPTFCRKKKKGPSPCRTGRNKENYFLTHKEKRRDVSAAS